MIEYEEMIYNIQIYDDGFFGKDGVEPDYGGGPGSKKIGLADVCTQFNLTIDEDDENKQFGYTPRKEPGPKCKVTQRPLDFVYEKYNDTYNITEARFKDDTELLELIQTGKGDPEIYTGFQNLYVDYFLGGTNPVEVEQNLVTGRNDIQTAKATYFTSIVDQNRNPEYTEDMYSLLEWEWTLAAKEWSKNSKHINVEVLTLKAFMMDILGDFNSDLILIEMAIFMVSFYICINIGGLSPIHCRCCVSGWGLTCVLICYFAGFSVAFNLGYKMSGVHSLMSFLLVGIGGDDMFVLANAIDQTPFDLHPNDRFINAMIHAGPSITITTFTNALAFYFGSSTPIPALSDFCVFAAFCVLCLYGAVLTIFLCILAWDVKRQSARKRECCGCCCCKEDTIICCRGRFLTDK